MNKTHLLITSHITGLITKILSVDNKNICYSQFGNAEINPSKNKYIIHKEYLYYTFHNHWKKSWSHSVAFKDYKLI